MDYFESEFCTTPLWVEINKNTSIFDFATPCFAFAAVPSFPTIFAFLTLICLFIYGYVFNKKGPKLDFHDQWTLIKMTFCMLSYIVCIRKGVESSIWLHLCWVLQIFCMIPGMIVWTHFSCEEKMGIIQISALAIYVAIFVVATFQVVLFCYADRLLDKSYLTINGNVKNGLLDNEKCENRKLDKEIDPELKSSSISQLVYAYIGDLLKNGFKRQLTTDDFYGLYKGNTSDYLTKHFDKILRRRNRQHVRRAKRIPSILAPVLELARSKMSKSILLSLIQTPLMLISPFFLSWIVDSVMDEKPFWFSCFLAFAMAVFNICAWVLLEKVEFYGVQAFSNIKTVLMHAIYKKMLNLSYASRAKFSTGSLINLVNTDIQRLWKVTWRAHGFITYPMTLIWCFIQLLLFIGHSAWSGLIVMVVILFLNMGVQKILLKYEETQMTQKDQRLKLSTELLKGIKIIKLYAWEISFQKIISECRIKELKAIRVVNIINMGVVESSFYISSVAATIVTLLTYTYFEGQELTPKTAFATLMLFVYMKNALLLFPELINEAMKGFISLRRISEFLDSGELVRYVEDRDDHEKAVMVKNGIFELENGSSRQSFKLGNVEIQKGSLVGVVGPVGSGKSAFLSVLKNEWPKTHGQVHMNTLRLADIPQIPWIQNKTLKDNICFKKPYDEDLFYKVIDACCLRDDIKLLAAGVNTEIGERGMNLSGGQRARVSLARAVYQQSDVYLIDDTLSAVDAHVGKHIFEKVLGPNGFLKDKTRIFALNSVQYLTEFDQVIVMEASTSEIDLQSVSNGHSHMANGNHAPLLENGLKVLSEESVKTCECRVKEIITKCELGQERFVEWVQEFTENNNVLTSFNKDANPAHHDDKKASEDSGKLTEEETVEEGHASWKVYYTYFRYFGFGLLALYLILLYIITASFEGLSNIWLAKWSSDEIPFNVTAGQKLLVYASSNGVACVCISICGAIFAFGGSRASRRLHDDFMTSLLHSPMSFFDQTPTGRILSRLSYDITRIDTELAYQIAFLGILTRYVFQCIITILIYIPLLIIFVIALVVFFGLLIRYYTRTSVQIRRLLSKSMSTLSSYVEDSYTGASSIRTYKVEKEFEAHMKEIIDGIIKIELAVNVVNRWINVRLAFITQLVVCGFVTVAIYMADYNLISLGILAMIITNGATFSNELSYVAKTCRDIEMHVVAVERMAEYIGNQPEASWTSEKHQIPQNWPTSGEIAFKDLSLRYRDDKDLVLKNLNFEVAGGQMVGIVGRTGAGKSSITLALFRVVEAAGGQILIDGEDISQLGLHELRNALTIIPQEPVLFSGTLKFNLDPENKFVDDSDIWRALDLAQLKDFVSASPEKLDFKIEEGGENLSIGQRQLVCLARAILRSQNTKILILDEATASIDMESDRCIQKVIRENFKHCTILTIAHRINTILDYDSILVMDAGEKMEYEKPENLLKNEESLFYSLYKESGLEA